MFKKIKSKKGEALLLIVIVSMVTMAIVLGVMERTNRQLTVQKQNAEYNVAFANAESAIAALVSKVNNGDIDPNTTNFTTTTLNNLPPTLDYKLQINSWSATLNVPAKVVNDNGIWVEQATPTSLRPVTKFSIWCPISKYKTPGTALTSAVVLKIIHSDGTLENIITECNDPGNIINGAGYTNSGTLPNGYSVAVDNTWTPANSYDPNVISDYTTVTKFIKLDYTVPSAKQNNIQGILAVPKLGFNNSVVTDTEIMVKLFNGTNVVGASNPLTGTAFGYGSNGRTATINFSINTSAQIPSYLNYVMFEGN